MTLMEDGLDEGGIPLEVTDHDVALTFNKATAYLRKRASYIWNRKRSPKPEAWAISTWSKQILRPSIEKKGTDADKAALVTHQKKRSKVSLSLEFLSQAEPKKRRSRLQDVIAPSQDRKNSNGNESEEAEESNGEDDIIEIIQGTTPTYVQEEVSGPNPDQPHQGRERIKTGGWNDLRTAGRMICGRVVRSYLNIAIKDSFLLGALPAGAEFFQTLCMYGWDTIMSRMQFAKDGTPEIDWVRDPLILVPIFTGATTCGHFSGHIIDSRTVRKSGLLLYFDTIKSLGDETFTVLKDRVEKTPICTSSSRLSRQNARAIQRQAQMTVEYGSAMPLGLTSDIPIDVGIVCGDFIEADLKCVVSAQQHGIMGCKHMMRTTQRPGEGDRSYRQSVAIGVLSCKLAS